MKRRGMWKNVFFVGVVGMILGLTGCGSGKEQRKGNEPEITREAEPQEITQQIENSEITQETKEPEKKQEEENQNPPEEAEKKDDMFRNIICGKMPLVLIETEQESEITDDTVYTGCNVTVTNCEKEYEVIKATAGIRIRGNSTQMYAKKPYRIKFEEKQQVLGLSEGAHKSWVLLAEFNDPALLRNLVTYELASGMSGISYATDCTLVEVYINGEYNGVYLLAEQTQVDNHRIAIDETGVTDPACVDTGYLLELEADLSRRTEEGAEGEAWFAVTGYASEKDNSMQMLMERSFDEKAAYYVVKSDARSGEQMEYIKNYMIQVYDAVYKVATKEAVEELVDLPSAVDMYLVQLLANDYDNNYSSMYLYKDAGGKLQFGAPWDFDLAYGNFTGFTEAEDTVYVYHLLKKLGDYDWFREMAKDRYEELFMGEAGLVARMKTTIKQLTENYSAEFEREYACWRENLTSMAGGFGGFGNFGDWQMPEGEEFGGFGNFGDWQMPEGENFGGFGNFGDWQMPEGENFGDFGNFGDWQMPEGGAFGDFGNFGDWQMPEDGAFGDFGNFGDWQMPEGGAFGGFGDMGNFSYGAVYDTHKEAAEALLGWIEQRTAWIQTFLQTDGEV